MPLLPILPAVVAESGYPAASFHHTTTLRRTNPGFSDRYP